MTSETQLCEGCGTQDLTDGIYRDWSGDPHYGVCLTCAAGITDAQWHSPGDVIGGTAPLGTNPTVSERFIAFHTAEFWAMVWEGRVKYPLDNSSTSSNEAATVSRLDEVEEAMSANKWERAFGLLEPVGASGWGARESPALYAWRPENCARVASAWCRLREYRLLRLPESIIEVIRRRGFRRDSRRRTRYEQEQRAIETEVMFALRDELSQHQEALRGREQEGPDYGTQIAELNRWIRSKTKGDHG